MRRWLKGKNNISATITIIGGGPSGLMAADVLSAKGHHVTIYERKPSFARKFLMAGRGGLNITHSDPIDDFILKYGAQHEKMAPLIHHFTPQNMQDWCASLGEETFIGSSGRVFPKSFKASPLLRAWLSKLEKQNVEFHLNHDWQGWDKDQLYFKTHEGEKHIKPDITLLALGGATWPRLGADGSWVQYLENKNVEISPLKPSNCGFTTNWSPFFANKFKGYPLKSVALNFAGQTIHGEFIITENGIEGGAVYALSARIRDAIAQENSAKLTLDLKPDLKPEEIISRLQRPRKKLSLSNYLRKNLKLSDVAIGLLMEQLDRTKLTSYSAKDLTRFIKNYTLILNRPFAMERAISSAGGVKFDAIDDKFMLRALPNIFVTGEMIDWEAPTGGYLLQACIAQGAYVGKAISDYIKS